MLQRLWNAKNVNKQGVIWNIISSSLYSMVSFILLWFVTRINGVSTAGIFSLGLATSQLMLTLGNYGVRNYQATDVKGKYSLLTYFKVRILSNSFMMFFVIIFVLLENYNWQKLLITILMCVLRITDSFDDLYGGYYQKQGRLEISGKILTIRLCGYSVAFLVALYISHDLIISCVAAIVTSFAILAILVASSRKVLPFNESIEKKQRASKLLIDCLPLCLSSFMLVYLNSAPKYAIDAYLDDKSQAYFTYLFMPCFAINLFVGFALQPLMLRLSKYWAVNQFRDFYKLTILIFSVAIGIISIVLIAGGFLGCSVMSLVFGVDLLDFQWELLILLIGGAFFALSVIVQIILTIMRRQIYLLACFGISSLVAAIISNKLVETFSLLGASYAYAISAGVLFTTLFVMFIIFTRKKENLNQITVEQSG